MGLYRKILILFAWIPALIACAAIWSYAKKLSPDPIGFIISKLYREPPENGDVRQITTFGRERDFELWRRENATLAPSGGWGKIVFDAGSPTPGIRLRDYEFGPAGIKNWSDYRWIVWEMLPRETGGRTLIAIFKDVGERRFTKAFGLFEGTVSSVRVDLAEMTPWLDLERMAEIHFYMTKLESDAVVDIRDLRLVRGGALPDEALGTPFVKFEGLEAPEETFLGRTVEISAFLSLTEAQRLPYYVFMHLFHESGREEKIPSHRKGYIHVEKKPFLPVPDWTPGRKERIGPFYIHFSRMNPPGRYLIQLGLYNVQSSGRGPRDAVYTGAFNYGGSFPKCRYTDPAIKDFIVGSIMVKEPRREGNGAGRKSIDPR